MSRRPLVLSLTVVALGAPFAAGAQPAAGRPVVVVAPFVHGVGSTEADASQFTRGLQTALAAQSGVRWLPADSASGTAARFVVSGVLMVMGGSGRGGAKLDWRVVDATSHNVVANGVRTLASAQIADSTVRAFAGEIATLVTRAAHP